MKIAVCITTRDRHEVLEIAMAHHNAFLPEGAKLFLVDDASSVQVWGADYRFEDNVGVARAKNKCLELAEAWDADHIFLFDSDTYPLVPKWELPYIKCKEPHLLLQFKLPNKPATDMRVVGRGDDYVAYSHTRGAMIYLERRVLDAVGGFDTKYGLGYFEHPDLTNRIYNSGLTTDRAMDVPDSDKLLYCLDQDSKVESTLKPDKKRWAKNYEYYKSQENSKEYKEFRT